MLVRHGFISNSSTSSFCIYGVCFESLSELKSLLINPKIKENKDEICPDCEETIENCECENCECEYCDIEEFVSELKNIDIHQPDEDFIYIGRELSDIMEFEKVEDFKNEVKNELRKIFKLDDENFEVFDETYSN